MKRALPHAPWAARLSFILPLSLVALPAMALPAMAQTPEETPLPAAMNPWGGITVILLSPQGESPYEAAQRASDATMAAQAEIAGQQSDDAFDEPADEEEDIAGSLVEAGETPAPSLWNALRAGLGMAPATPQATAKLPERPSVVSQKARQVPTRLELKEGPASLAISTNASASSPVSGPFGTKAGGGSGEIKGRVGFEHENLTIYSAGSLGASASTGTPSLYDNIAVGSTYSVPLAPVGLGNDKLGASVEVNDTQTVITGVELRSPLGSYERFITVRRSASPDSDASGVVKAGVLGKF